MKPETIGVRAVRSGKSREITCLFDTGSEEGLMRSRAARGMTTVTLPDPLPVVGIGGGSVVARRAALFEARVLGKWCRYHALILPDAAVDVDLLVGEDFLSRYGLSVDARAKCLAIAYPEHFRRMTRRKIFIASHPR